MRPVATGSGPLEIHGRINGGPLDRLAERPQDTVDGERFIETGSFADTRSPVAARLPMTIDLSELDVNQPRKRVAVAASAHTDTRAATATSARLHLDPGHERLLAALERVFPVRFEPADSTDLSRVDGVLALGSQPGAEISAAAPRLTLACDPERPDAPVPGGGAERAGTSAELHRVALAHDSCLARPLRARVIPEHSAAGALSLTPDGSRTLATVDGRPVWWQLEDAGVARSTSAYPLAQLHDGETLRDHLRAGSFMRLLPLVQFLKQVLGDRAWRPPPLRASFVVDDPNLHWPSYGFLKYRELAAHAVHHGYHIGLATVPLDGWLADRRVTALLAENTSALSLLMHGNDHVARELGRLSTDDQAVPAIAQALRRIAALERRAGVSVERVMAPPHGACSEAALRAMFRLGLEAACSTQPHPWRDRLPASTPLAGWHPAELVAGGLPVLPRYPLAAPREDLALRALLGQPLIVYGHHGDFAQGLDILAQAAADIDGLGEVQWGPLGSIARRSYCTRTLDQTLLVWMHARQIHVEVPAGVRAVRVLVQEPLGGATGHSLIHRGGSLAMSFEGGFGTSEMLAVDGPARIALTLMADKPLSPHDIPSPAIRLWPVIRRALVEGRDRIEALR